MSLQILNMWRTYWTDAVVSRWARSGEHKLCHAQGSACTDCGHSVAYIKGGGKPLCSACMIISAKFPYGDEGKTTQFVNGQGMGGMGLLVLPDREELHLWLSQSLLTHAAVVEMEKGAGMVVHPTANKGNIDFWAFLGDLATWSFSSGEKYWAGVCQENDAHKVSHLMQDAVPVIWNGALSFKKSALNTVYFQRETQLILRDMASSPYWMQVANMIAIRVRCLGELEDLEYASLAQMDGADTASQKESISKSFDAERKRLNQVLQTQHKKEIETPDKRRISFKDFLVMMGPHCTDESLSSVRENMSFVLS